MTHPEMYNIKGAIKDSWCKIHVAMAVDIQY